MPARRYAFNDPVANIDKNGLIPTSWLCPGSSGLKVFLNTLGNVISGIAKSPLTRAIGKAASTGVKVANHVGQALQTYNLINSPFVTGVVGERAMNTAGESVLNPQSNNYSFASGGIEDVSSEPPWWKKFLNFLQGNDITGPIFQSGTTVFNGVNPNGSKASVGQRIGAGFLFLVRTGTLLSKGGEGEGLEEEDEGFEVFGIESEDGLIPTTLRKLADESLPAGQNAPNARVRGTLIHTKWEELARKIYGNKNVEIEQIFKGGKHFNYNLKGSIRVDLIIKSPTTGEPIGIFDLKTGNAGLTPARINKIRSNLPEKWEDVPIIEIRPNR